MSDPNNKDELLDRIYEGYRRFQEVVGPLTEQQVIQAGVAGEWSVKDILIHLTNWELYAMMRIEIAVHGLPLELRWTEDEEGYDRKNAQIYAANRDKPFRQAQREFNHTYQRMLDFVRELTEEDLFDASGQVAQRLGYPAWQLIAGNTDGHYEEHGETIRVWLGK